MKILPKLFIGSSSEGLSIAQELKRLLKQYADIKIWPDIFQLGDSIIVSLIREVNLCDYAILVATPDDLKGIRGKQEKTPRDNVIFEAGLFIGRLGTGRTFVLCDLKSETKLPTDLAGVTVATFAIPKKSEVLAEKLKPAVEKISSAIKKGGIDTEIDFLRSYLTFIHPKTRISDSYADILSRRLDSLRTEVKKLEDSQNWGKLLEVKSRLREYFEFSGRLEEGIEFGKAFLK
ncbi:MAG: nucleotide-binding protein, partial [Candidatus Aminicenantes bacterium]|nr:nucleotide-binding protein [Candidatus Aminicenantes bacterium]